MRLFTKAERSSFPYWFAHWCAFNMTAIMCNHWKPGYLLHNWYKPWIRIFLPYEKVQKFHRTHSRHHLEWLDNQLKNKKNSRSKVFEKFDWKGMLIDWECSRFTKLASPRTAAEEAKLIFNDEAKMCGKFRAINENKEVICNHYITKALRELGLIDDNFDIFNIQVSNGQNNSEIH